MSAKCHDISHPIVVANCANIPNMRLHIRAERMGSNTCTRWRVVQCVQLMMTRRSQGWINSDWEVMLLLPTLLCSIKLTVESTLVMTNSFTVEIMFVVAVVDVERQAK